MEYPACILIKLHHFILDITVKIWTLQCLSFWQRKKDSANSLHKWFPIIHHNFLKTTLLILHQDYGGGNSTFWWEKEWERTLGIQAGDKELSGVALCLSKGCFKSYSKTLLKQNNHSTIWTHTHTHKRVRVCSNDNSTLTGTAHKEVELDLRTFRHCIHRTMQRET